jgi:hypothetical protein
MRSTAIDNKTQHFQKFSLGGVIYFQQLTRGAPWYGTLPAPCANWDSPENCNGGGRSLQHNPNKYNDSLIPFSGGIAFHCTWKTPDRSDFAKIEHRGSDMAGQARDRRHFRRLPGGREPFLEGNLDLYSLPKLRGVSPKYLAGSLKQARRGYPKLRGVSPEYLAGSLKQARWATQSSGREPGVPCW